MARKKARVGDDSTGLAALPPTLQNHVIDFLVGDDYYHGNGRHYWSRQLHPLPTLAQVSKEWRVIADEPASSRVLATLRFRYKERKGQATRSDMLAMRNTLILRRAYLKRMILEDLPDFCESGEGIWQAALSHAPQLVSLDMDTGDVVKPPSRFVLDVTQAAARHCPLLQRLMFPASMKRSKQSSNANHMREFTDGVLACLPAWTKHGGLRHLRLTMRERVHGRKRMHSYLDTISKYCPKIEILDGFATAVASVEIVTCEEAWYVDLDTWTRFCETCTHLKYFDWVTVPFATRFFEIFAATPKPKLVNLTFSASALWHWRTYFATTGPATKGALETTGYGGAARNAHLILAACPSLREVRVEWFDVPRLGYSRSSPKFHINPEIFGDTFCEALARHCKGLTRLQHGPVPTDHPKWSPASLVTLTDRSLRALATLPDLTWVEIVGANITADGLWDLVINHAASTRAERVYFFSLGDTTDNGVTSMVLYDVLQGFLDRLLEYDGELPCASRPIMLQLENANKKVLEEGWSAAFFSTLRLTIEKLEQKFPTLQFSGVVRDHDEEYDVIKSVVEFAFATETAQLPDWNRDFEEIGAADDEIPGSVFLSRRYFGRDMDHPGEPGSRRGDDETDSDEEDDGGGVGDGGGDAIGSDGISEDSDEPDEDEDDDDDVDEFGIADGEEIVFDDDDDVEFSDDDDEFVSDDDVEDDDEQDEQDEL